MSVPFQGVSSGPGRLEALAAKAGVDPGTLRRYLEREVERNRREQFDRVDAEGDP